MFPQESGGWADVRGLQLTKYINGTAAACKGQLLLSTDCNPRGKQMSVSQYSMQQLAAAKHQHELSPDQASIHVHMDVAHMGVGGDDSNSLEGT